MVSDKDGVVRMTFTMPEALTTWRFLGFAHDRACRSGYLEGKTVTAKDLMVQPNPPRFLREGDVVEFTVKVTNQTDARQTGRVRLTFNDARTEQSADKLLDNFKPELDFDLPAKESRSCAWRIQVPDGAPFLTYKAVASTGKVSDGEEGYLPVLARRILVTESLPLPIRGPATKKFEFNKLLKSGQSSTLRHQSLTVQMVSNPAWYAVMALPYLMEFPHECTEQTFNRLYANALARFIANSDPKIRRVFDQWKGTPALDSPMEKNQDLKSVMIEETPWLRQAQSESQARKNVGILFDANRLDNETERVLQKLTEAQLPDGAWPWFPGGRGNDYITLYITTGFGRLRHLGADLRVDAAIRSLARLDGWMNEHYRRILTWPDPEKYVPSSTDALYLYGRSFFLKDRPIAKPHQQAVNFFLGQSRKHWLKVNCRQSQGHLAIALQRFGDKTTAQDIMRSIKERAVSNEEMGMFWRETELSWWWYRAPIETQALMIEAFDEVMGDKQAVEDCRVWLLKQKQTQDWKTTKATADAVYGLLLRGKDILASDKLVEVIIGGINVTAEIQNPKSKIQNQPEPGTGFYEKHFS
ncbi:MAG: alpha-2-macroglobulin family protein, partial [Verrucomicrobia bacterium]|nr:alpha-2-macroglobulin family protein [Verrucomicrobiota bacterium]